MVDSIGGARSIKGERPAELVLAELGVGSVLGEAIKRLQATVFGGTRKVLLPKLPWDYLAAYRGIFIGVDLEFMADF